MSGPHRMSFPAPDGVRGRSKARIANKLSKLSLCRARKHCAVLSSDSGIDFFSSAAWFEVACWMCAGRMFLGLDGVECDGVARRGGRWFPWTGCFRRCGGWAWAVGHARASTRIHRRRWSARPKADRIQTLVSRTFLVTKIGELTVARA